MRDSQRTNLLAPPEVMWMVFGVWAVGAGVMALGAILGSAESVMLGLTRALLMSPIGAALSISLWRASGGERRSHGAKGVLVATGVALAVLVHLFLDLATERALTALLDLPAPRRTIIADNPYRATAMSLFVQTNILLFGVLHALVGIATIALRAGLEAQERERQLAQAKATAAGAQLEALRYQLNPHFLFNTLNAIGSLVERGRQVEAREMLDRLSEFLRSSLGEAGNGTATVEEELAIIQRYLAIEAVRFGERLKVVFDCPPELGSATLPSFALQPLVENAVKHAVARAVGQTTVRITVRRDKDDLLVAVEDNGADEGYHESSTPVGTGVGLRNVRQRLALLYGDRGQLEAGKRCSGYAATMRLPLTRAGNR